MRADLDSRLAAGDCCIGDSEGWEVPRISSFYGIVIAMYHQEEHRRPHFHAAYAGADASIAIDTLEVLAGSLPRRALSFAREWARLHRDELIANWELARRDLPLNPIDPLP